MSHNEGLNRIATLTGVPGVGKGFYQKQLHQRGEMPSGLRITSMGSELLAYFASKYAGVRSFSRDDIKYLTQADMDKAFEGIVGNVIAKAPVLLDSHVVTHREGTILASQEPVHLKIRSERFLHLCAEPKLIFEQRMTDTSRSRVNETISDIDRHQTMSLEATRRLAGKLGAEMVEIWNNQDGETVERNLGRIREELQKLMRRNDKE